MDKDKKELLNRKQQIIQELEALSKKRQAIEDNISSLEFQYRRLLDEIYARN